MAIFTYYVKLPEGTGSSTFDSFFTIFCVSCHVMFVVNLDFADFQRQRSMERLRPSTRDVNHRRMSEMRWNVDEIYARYMTLSSSQQCTSGSFVIQFFWAFPILKWLNQNVSCCAAKPTCTNPLVWSFSMWCPWCRCHGLWRAMIWISCNVQTKNVNQERISCIDWLSRVELWALRCFRHFRCLGDWEVHDCDCEEAMPAMPFQMFQMFQDTLQSGVAADFVDFRWLSRCATDVPWPGILSRTPGKRCRGPKPPK